MPTEMTATPDGTKILLSNTTLKPRPRQLEDRRRAQRDDKRPASPRLGMLDVKTAKLLAQLPLSERQRVGALNDDWVLLLQEDPTRADILSAATLAKHKTLESKTRIHGARRYGKLFLLSTESTLDFYDPATGKLVKQFEVGRGPHDRDTIVEFTERGMNLLGIHYDLELQPELAVRNFYLQSLGETDNFDRREEFMLPREQRDSQKIRPERQQLPGELALETAVTPDGVIVDAVAKEGRSGLSATPTHLRHTLDLTVTARGQARGSQLLCKLYGLYDDEFPWELCLALAQGEALVAYNNQLYRWPLPASVAARGGEGPALPPAFVPRQSSIALGDKETTLLRHDVQHGTKPYRFALATPRAGMTLDEKTGDLTLDNKQVRAQAAGKLEEFLNNAGAKMQALQFLQTYANLHAARMLGRPPRGIPITIPIEVRVEDAQRQSSKLQYFIIAEVPTEPYVEQLKKADEAEARAQQAELEQRKAAQAAAQAPPDAKRDLPALNQKLDALEQRLDQTNRALSEVLKQLEKQQAQEK